MGTSGTTGTSGAQGAQGAPGGSGTGGGDVTGPSSSDTYYLTKFADATGKVITQSLWAETDGDLWGPSGVSAANTGYIYIPSDADAPTGTPGSSFTLGANRAALYWDSNSKRLYVYDTTNGWKYSAIFT
jgi:hypothetical protein